MISSELREAARLADPVDPGSGAPPTEETGSAADPARVAEMLRAGKVPLLEIPLERLPRSSVFHDAVERERREQSALAAEFSTVAAALAARGITPVLFKTPGGLPYRSSNVDLLVRPDQMKEVSDLLESLGHLKFPHYREDHKLLFRRFDRGRSAICIHLHEAVSWGKVTILPGDQVVARARRVEGAGYAVAGREDLLLITLAHSLYETDQIRLADLRVLRLCAALPGFDWAQVEERAAVARWSRGLASILTLAVALERSVYGSTKVPDAVVASARSLVDERRWTRAHVSGVIARLDGAREAPMPFPLSKLWSKAHAGAVMLRAPGRAAGERLEDLVSTAWSLLANRLRLRCRPPILVSLTGLDGSGKSSAIRALADAMTLCEIPVAVVWSRGGFTTPARAVKKAARSVMGPRLPGPEAAEDKRRWLAGPIAGGLFAALVAAEQSFHYLARVRVPRWLGRSILCDRFVHDVLADLEAKLGAGRPAAALAGRVAVAAAPRPDLAFLLRLDPRQAALRKPGDVPPSQLDRQAEIFDRLAAAHGLLVVDAARPDDEVIGELVDRVLRETFARFSGERP